MAVVMMLAVRGALAVFSLSQLVTHFFSQQRFELGIFTSPISQMGKPRHGGEIKYYVSGDKYSRSKGNSKAQAANYSD